MAPLFIFRRLDEKVERRWVLDGSRLGLTEPFSYVHGEAGSVNPSCVLAVGSRGGHEKC
jgi:hypothetical protein